MTKHPLLHLYQPVREQQHPTAGRAIFCCGAVCYQDNGVLCLFKDSITSRFITSKGQQRLKLHQGPDHTGSTLDLLSGPDHPVSFRFILLFFISLFLGTIHPFCHLSGSAAPCPLPQSCCATLQVLVLIQLQVITGPVLPLPISILILLT